MANFIVQFPLKTEVFQENVLAKRLEIGRKIYNSLVTVTQKRYKEMIKTKKYRNLIALLSGNKETDKLVWSEINGIRKQFGMSEYSFHKDVKQMQKHFKQNIDSFTAQKIASSLWKAYSELFYGDGDEIHYRKYGYFNSLEGKSNKTGICFKNDYLIWNGLTIPVTIDYNNYYEYQAMQCDISYCRIVRKFVCNKDYYYVQIVFNGVPPVKLNSKTGDVKHNIGNGDVGLDIGVSTIAISSKQDVKILELADKVQNTENKKKNLLRKMDRSRRSTNPDNFNSDGSAKKQGNKKVNWVKSNRYTIYQNQLKELYRRQADVRKYQHECLSNYIISLGDKIYVEKMSFSGLQKRAKKTEKKENGKIKRKKRFGKSLANRAPAMLLSMIDRKLKYNRSMLFKIDTQKAKASQYNHFNNTYVKKKLSQRWNDFDGVKIQRDMYSAFLIMNINSDLESFNIEKCNSRYDDFKKMHDTEVNRLKGNKNLSCIAI